MSSKKWVKYFLAILLLVPINALLNYTINPYGIFNTNLFKKDGPRNERFIKIKYLDENHTKFNSYMFGSSRIGTTEPTSIGSYINNSKFYNFTLASANMYDHLIHLQYFIKNYKIENLYLQIDIENMSFYKGDKSYMKPHPHVVNEDTYSFYKTYLLAFQPIGLKRKLQVNFFPNEVIKYNFKNGVWYRPTKEFKITNDPQKYINNEPSFNNTNVRRAVPSLSYYKIINSFDEIVKLCKNHNINLIVFTTPSNKNMMDKYDIKSYLKFISDISMITNFHDFSGYNTITKNNFNYYEESHYRPFIGDIVAARIFNDKSIKVPSDFGVYVTKDNVTKHLTSLKIQIETYDRNKDKK